MFYIKIHIVSSVAAFSEEPVGAPVLPVSPALAAGAHPVAAHLLPPAHALLPPQGTQGDRRAHDHDAYDSAHDTNTR